MNCRTFAKKLYDYQDDALAGSEKAEFELHRSACARCAAQVEAESRGAELFRAAVQDACEELEFDPSSSRRSIVSARRRPSLPSPIMGWRIAAAVAALFLVVLLVPPIAREIGREPAESPAKQVLAEPGSSWAEEIDVTYESGLVAETTLISHDSGATSIIEIQVSYHP